jgi:DNA-binding transcriptional ArsR family regulator
MKQNELNVDRAFQALGDATRRAMLERLTDRPMSVSRLAEPFKMSLAAVVQHLQILEEAGLVKTEKLGRVRSCWVESAGLDLAAQWLEARRPEWERKLDRLGELLGEPDAE